MQSEGIVIMPSGLRKRLSRHILPDQQCVTGATDLDGLDLDRRRVVVVGPPDLLARLSGLLLMRYVGSREKFTYILPPRFQDCVAQVKRFLKITRLRHHCRLVVPRHGFLQTVLRDCCRLQQGEPPRVPAGRP